MEKLYEMVDKAPKLPTSSVNENVHTDHYKLKEELKMSEIKQQNMKKKQEEAEEELRFHKRERERERERHDATNFRRKASSAIAGMVGITVGGPVGGTVGSVVGGVVGTAVGYIFGDDI